MAYTGDSTYKIQANSVTQTNARGCIGTDCNRITKAILICQSTFVITKCIILLLKENCSIFIEAI